MGHATAEAVVSAGLELVPWSFTGESEAVVVGNVGVSGIPVQLIGKEERQEAMQRVKDEYPGLVMIDFTLPGAVNGEIFSLGAFLRQLMRGKTDLSQEDCISLMTRHLLSYL